MYDGILFKDGKYEVYVKIQDGTEKSGPFSSLEEAKKDWAEAHQILNHTKRDPNEAHVYELIPVIEYKLKRIA
jgi:hypothetical protein